MQVSDGIEFDEDELATQLKSSSRVDIRRNDDRTDGETERRGDAASTAAKSVDSDVSYLDV